MHIRAEDSSTKAKRDEWAEKIRRGAEAIGIERCCLIGELTHEYYRRPFIGSDERRQGVPDLDLARRNNDIVASYCRENPDLFYGYARVDPRWGDAAVEELRRCVEDLGLVGLKVHFRDTPIPISDPAFEPLAETLVDLDAPLLPHVQQRPEPWASDPFFESESQSEDVAALARAYPDLDILSAHIGGGTLWETQIKTIADYDNVYLDTSGSNATAGVIEMAVDHLGVDRVVFGTDMYFVTNVGKLEGANLTPEEKATIAYNFETLLGDHVPNRLGETELAERQAARRDWFERRAEPREETVVDAYAFTAGHWPFNPLDESVDALLDIMDRKGVDSAVVSSLNAVFYRNPQNGNRELDEAITDHRDRFIPFATIDPTYPAWRRDLDVCLDEFDMRGVRLLPAYHAYDVNEPPVQELMDHCATRDIPVMFCAALEDQRHKHHRVDLHRIESGDTWTDEQVDHLVEVLQVCPETDVIIANAFPHAGHIRKETTTTYGVHQRLYNKVRTGRTLFVLGDRHAMSHPDAGRDIVETVGVDHLVAGQQLPFKYFEAAYDYTEHLPVSDQEKAKVRSENLLDLVDEA